MERITTRSLLYVVLMGQKWYTKISRHGLYMRLQIILKTNIKLLAINLQNISIGLPTGYRRVGGLTSELTHVYS